MNKNQLLFGKIRLALYGLVIALFAVSGITLFIVSQFQRARYTEANVQLANAKSTLETLEGQPDSYKKTKQVEYYSDLENYFTTEVEASTKTYKACSTVSYTLTMMALVAFGVCLKVEDYFKSKEEK